MLELAQALLTLGGDLRFMRDPTRGGACDGAQRAGAGLGHRGRSSTRRRCLCARRSSARRRSSASIPLYVACEGRLVAVVAAEACERALALLRSQPLGAEAAIIGEVRAEPAGLVLLETAFGGSRVVDMLVGDPLPRIC